MKKIKYYVLSVILCLPLLGFAAAAKAADGTPPSIPTGLTAVINSNNKVDLSWSASNDDTAVAGYIVLRNGDQITSLSGTNFTDTTVASGTTYTYAVRAYDSSGNLSGLSEAATIMTGGGGSDTSVPTAPGSLTVTTSGTQAVLNWNASSDNVGVTGYRIMRNGSFLREVTGTSFTDTGLATSTSYSYAVIARDAAGNYSGSSNVVVITTSGSGSNGSSDTVAPSVPANFVATLKYANRKGWQNVQLSWAMSTDNVGVVSYEILRNGSVIAKTSGLGYKDKNLASSTAYTYAVRALDAAGNRSASSDPQMIVTGNGGADRSMPKPPTLTVTSSNGQAMLSWSGASDNVAITGYVVTRNGKLLATINSNSNLMYTDTAPLANRVNVYRVRAFDAAGNISRPSNAVMMTGGSVTNSGQDVTAPTQPRNLVAEPSDNGGIRLYWSASSDDMGVTGYTIWRDGSFLATTTGRSYTDPAANNDQEYSYAVRAFDAAGNVSVASQPASLNPADNNNNNSEDWMGNCDWNGHHGGGHWNNDNSSDGNNWNNNGNQNDNGSWRDR